jgi:glycosyltransferase involved in cell wall biosynthesis
MSKIFIGLVDISSQLRDIKYGFKKLGYDVMTVSVDHNTVIQRNDVDYYINKLWPFPFFQGVRPRKLQRYLQDKGNPAKNYIFKKALRECDTFIYIFRGFYKDYKDFEIIRDKGKKIIYIFTGGHERWYYAAKQDFEMHTMRAPEYSRDFYSTLNHLEQSLSIVRNVEKYANCTVSLPEQSQLFMRPYYRYNLPCITEEFEHSSFQRKIPKIIHAPSNPEFKGTKYFLKAISKLKEENIKFEFELIQGLPHLQALERYQQSDIILNQLGVPGGGKLAIEGMALGKVVLSLMGYGRYDQQYHTDCPVVDVDPDNIYQKLKEIILDHKFRTELAEKGRVYVEKNHSAIKFAGELIMNLEDDNINPDFRPTFFRDTFIPESLESIPVYNKWTQYVSNCNWYKSNISEGERAGLIF